MRRQWTHRYFFRTPPEASSKSKVNGCWAFHYLSEDFHKHFSVLHHNDLLLSLFAHQNTNIFFTGHGLSEYRKKAWNVATETLRYFKIHLDVSKKSLVDNSLHEMLSTQRKFVGKAFFEMAFYWCINFLEFQPFAFPYLNTLAFF